MTQQVPPGWYPDPQDPTFLGYRYWDGGTWTGFTSDDLSHIERVGPEGLPNGRRAWAMGFWAWIPLPFFGMIIGAVCLAPVYRTGRLQGSALCTENSRRAANWGLTMLTVMVLCAAYMIAIGNLAPASLRDGFFPIGAGLIVYFALALAHTVVTIAGTVVAGRGKVFNPRIAIPFIRG